MKAKEAGEKKDSTDNTNKVAVVGDRIQEQKINKPVKLFNLKFLLLLQKH